MHAKHTRMKQSQTKQQCRLLRRRGFSIGQIAKIVRRSESTVHWHVSDILLTKTQRLRLHDQWRSTMLRVNAARRGHSIKSVNFRTPAWSSELVRLIAHLSFDGRIDRYGCSYYNRAYTQATQVKQLLQRLLGVKPTMRLRANGVWIVSYYHVELADWLIRREQELIEVIGRYPGWRREWLQALFDDEGHIHIAHGIRRIRASQNNLKILGFAKNCLGEFGIQSRIDLRAQAIEITGRENLLGFRTHINFSPGLLVNEHRENGLWKRPFEKRKLLSFALDSYHTTIAL